LLWEKLPNWMGDKQKKIKINNLLSEMRKKNRIINVGTDTKPNWVLVSSNNKIN
jgi:ATP-dependent DNA helicase RecG